MPRTSHEPFKWSEQILRASSFEMSFSCLNMSFKEDKVAIFNLSGDQVHEQEFGEEERAKAYFS